jgi:transposase
MAEQMEYEIIKGLVDYGGNKSRAALRLGCSRRSIDRHIAGYRAEGKAYFEHGNSGRRPSHSLDERIIADVRDFYLNKYPDANIAHFTELLQKDEHITISESAVRNILTAADILSPKAWRKTRKDLMKKLEAKIEETKSPKEAARMKAKIVAAEDAHPRRPRCSKFGEMIQMDASLHLWFGDGKVTLHLAIDDATGIVVGAWFEEQETLRGYYHVLEQILTRYGIPFMFYTDRRTVFEYRKSGSQDTADDSFTQFGYACKQLGIQIKTTSIPQAKGRIERLNETLQSRLPVELRLKGVTTIEQANEFLPGFIANYNARFALKADSISSVFETQPSQEIIDKTLAVVTERTVDTGHSIRFENKYWRTVNKDGMPVYFYKGTKGLVIRTFSGDLFFSTDDGVFALEEIPEHERSSKNFDFKPIAQTPKARYIPAPDHPWRRAAFVAYVKKHAHRSDTSA